MTELKFNDGITIKMGGQLRVIWKRDGYYVVGEGMSIPVESREEGKKLIKEWKN